VRFHCWLQWLTEVQLQAAAGAGSAIVTDLAVGADPAGADAWRWQDVLATGVTIGAPPDGFNPDGQDWSLPPFDPWRLRAAGYEPFAEVVRAAVSGGFGVAASVAGSTGGGGGWANGGAGGSDPGRGEGRAGGGGVRIDHVAGLFRLFWVPAGGDGPSDGVYVRYPAEDLLNVLALEAHRAGAFVVGEDLGTVEPAVREVLAARNVLSYRLLWFEGSPPAEWPQKALAAVTTHDLPTVSGVWRGADAEARRSIGLAVDERAEEALRAKLRDAAARPDAGSEVVGPEAAGPQVGGRDAVGPGVGGPHVGGRDMVAQEPSLTEVVRRAYATLAASPALLVAATLDDALEVDERPNQPGTTVERPNWSIALPVAIEDIEADERVRGVAEALARGRDGSTVRPGPRGVARGQP